MKHTLYKSKVLKGALFVGAFFVGVSLFLGSGGHAFAATETWTGTAGDGKFSTGGNWQSGVAPAAGDDLKFNVSSTLLGTTVNNDMTSLSVGSISFGGTPQTGSTAGFTITGNAITLTGATPVSGSVAGAVVSRVSAPVILSANSTIAATTTGTCTSSSVGLQLDDVTTGTNTVTTSGCVKIINLSTSGDVTGGTGTLVLGALSGISGHVIATGHVQVDGAQGSVAGFTVQNGGSLDFYPLDTTNITITKPLTLNGSGGVDADGATWNTVDFGAGNAPAMTYTYSGPVTLQTNANVGTPGNVDTVVFNGTVVANGHLLGYINGAQVTATGGAAPYVQQGTFGSDSNPGDNNNSSSNNGTANNGVATTDGKVPGTPNTGVRESNKNTVITSVIGVTLALGAGLPIASKKWHFLARLLGKK